MHLDRLISILEAIAVAGRPLSPTEVTLATGLPRPTCYRLLQSLAYHRLLEENADSSRYLIGDRLKRLILLGNSDNDVSKSAAPALREAAIEFGEAVFFSRFKNKSVEIISVEIPTDAARSFIHPGLGKRPLHACSCSKAIAAFADDSFQQEILSGPLQAFTGKTKTQAKLIEKEFAEIRERGFAECVEEVDVGVSSVAVPIRLGDLGVPFSVGATGPIRRFTESHREKIGHGLIDVANQIVASLQLAKWNTSA